jgi:C-terminal processing protease CtpA/Prc
MLEAVVPGSPAGASGQLQPGDAILAVSGPNGSWVDARSRSMGELIGMIRGEPNTQVSLQVQSPGQTAPRTVTLGRQQIINRPQ